MFFSQTRCERLSRLASLMPATLTTDRAPMAWGEVVEPFVCPTKTRHGSDPRSFFFGEFDSFSSKLPQRVVFVQECLEWFFESNWKIL